jgi:hypothetical protein
MGILLMAMLPFSPTFASGGVVRFLPANTVISPSGGASLSYPAEPYSAAGVVVPANVQPYQVERVVSDGIVRYTTDLIICLLADPSSLNGGLGVRRGDAFWWSLDTTGRLHVVQGDGDLLRTVWRYRCLASE